MENLADGVEQAVLFALYDRQIDRDRNRGEAGLAPGHVLSAGSLEHPCAQLGDQAAGLG